MKEGIIPILLIIAAVVSAAVFSNKINRQSDGLDKLEVSLSGARKHIAPGSHITLRCDPPKNELFFWVRYTLAPNYVALRAHTYDTVLTIGDNSTLGHILHDIDSSKRKLLWQNNDGLYCYFLTSGR